MKRTVAPNEEWFFILNQQVPSSAADKILAMLDGDIAILFSLTDLSIEISPHGEPSKKERLPLWNGVSYSKGHGYGRIIAMSGNMKVSASSVSGG
jgi:hypothetical protein